MRVLKSVLALVLSLQLVAPGTTAAQQHVTSRAVLESMTAQASARDDSARAAIREVLQREEVRRVAADVGLSIPHAERAVAMPQAPNWKKSRPTRARSTRTSRAAPPPW